MLSPLRYPGGKSDFIKTAIKIVEDNNLSGMSMVEPYAGSAAISLGLLEAGVISHTTLVERDPLIYSFWKTVFEHTDELIDSFNKLPITLDTWNELKQCFTIDKPKKSELLRLGIAGLFFNRTNFSGILNAGPIGGKEQKSAYKIDCRTNKNEIAARIKKIASYSPKISVEFGDAIDFISLKKNETNLFFYLDPPYFIKGESLYRYYYKLKEHKDLAKALANAKFSWLLSYDDHHVIEFLYEDFHMKRYAFQYSAGSPKNHSELLVSNFKILQSSLDGN